MQLRTTLFLVAILTVLSGCSSSSTGAPGETPGGDDAAAHPGDAAGAQEAAPGTDAGGGGPDGTSPMDGGGVMFDASGFDVAPPTSDGGTGTRSIPPAVFQRKALSYSGFRAGQSPELGVYPSAAQVTEDLKLLVQGGWTFLRLFECDQFAATTLKAIHDNNLDIKVMQGVWVYGPAAGNDASTQAEIQRCLALNSMYSDIIVAFSVGNETLDDWSNILTPVADLTAYINEVRDQVTQPVTTDDMYVPFTFGSDGTYSYAPVLQVAKAVDFLAIHCYAFIDAPYQSWDWQQLAVPAGTARAVAMMNAAEQYEEDSITQVRQALAGQGLNLPIVLGEVGWKSTPALTNMADTTEVYRAHPVNEKMFYDNLMAWVYGNKKNTNSPLAAFYFEGFDEPWKQDDDGWGLFDANRNAKYAVWDLFPNMKPPGAPNYSQSDAVYYTAPADAGGD
jgi:exo-beta-1,3-glucanase (GH17 family)